MKRKSPVKIHICAIPTRSNKYKEAPINRTKMPSRKMFENNNSPLQKSLLFVIPAIIIILTIYYLPNYFFLEKVTAQHTVMLLNSLGIPVQMNVIGQEVFLANIRIVKDCTGVQVIAVFFGILLPLPNAPWKKKLLSLGVVSVILYAANVLRIALEFSLVYFKILPWSLAHYPLSLLLGIIGVVILVFVTDHLLPELADFIRKIAIELHPQRNRKTSFR